MSHRPQLLCLSVVQADYRLSALTLFGNTFGRSKLSNTNHDRCKLVVLALSFTGNYPRIDDGNRYNTRQYTILLHHWNHSEHLTQW